MKTKKRKNTKAPPQKRGVQLHRALAICFHLQGRKYGETQAELFRLLEGRCCSRTVRRDLEVLRALGCVSWEIRNDGQRVWHWVPVAVLKLLEGGRDGTCETEDRDQEQAGPARRDDAEAL